MRQPRGFERGKRVSAWKLKGALYGLKQAGREWHQEINGFLREIGLVSLPDDRCIYANPYNSLIVLLYVDDLLIAYQERLDMRRVVDSLTQKYDIKYLGDAAWFFGMRIRSDRDAVTLHMD